MPGALDVLVFGHSFTRRLRDWCQTNGKIDLGLSGEREINVFWHGVGGAIISPPSSPKSIWQDLPIVESLSPDIVFLDIGTNDLARSNDPHGVARAIFDLACHIARHLSKSVVISQILPRRHPSSFAYKVNACNTTLEALCTSHPTIKFWTHSRNNFFSRFVTDFVAPDGVHVCNDRGMHRYYYSVRSAVMFAERSLANC